MDDAGAMRSTSRAEKGHISIKFWESILNQFVFESNRQNDIKKKTWQYCVQIDIISQRFYVRIVRIRTERRWIFFYYFSLFLLPYPKLKLSQSMSRKWFWNLNAIPTNCEIGSNVQFDCQNQMKIQIKIDCLQKKP